MVVGVHVDGVLDNILRVEAVVSRMQTADVYGQHLAHFQQFFVPIRDLSTKYTIIQSSLASAERVFGFLDTDDLENGPSGADGGTPPSPMPEVAGTLRFEHVSFGYRPDEPVLHDVDFELRLLDPVEEPPLKVEARGPESLPLAAQRFVVKRFDQSKALRAALFCDSLPCLISNTHLARRAANYFTDGLCLKDPPHMQ